MALSASTEFQHPLWVKVRERDRSGLAFNDVVVDARPAASDQAASFAV